MSQLLKMFGVGLLVVNMWACSGTLETEEVDTTVEYATADCIHGNAWNSAVEDAIRDAFGSHGNEAILVARCESGRDGTSAQNGQYLGLFQMGHAERAKYGHSVCAVGQSRAAHQYFVDSGRDWSPWTCKP